MRRTRKTPAPKRRAHAPTCDYCGQPSVPADGRTVYPYRPDLWHQRFFMCEPCDAWVGTHRKSGLPLGRLANAELRRARMAAHAAFDPIWKDGDMSRTRAYEWLAEAMGIEPDYCHIGLFDVWQCEKVKQLCAGRDFADNSLEADQ